MLWSADLVQVWVSGDVVAPLLGFDASFGVASRMADPHRPNGRRRSPVRVTRGAGQQPQPTRGRRAPTQRQRGSSWERVHATCGHAMWGKTNKVKYKQWGKVTFDVNLKGHVT